MLLTGKSLELMGFATINGILAMVLPVTFLSGGHKTDIQRLTRANITDFVNQVTMVSSGTGKDTDLLQVAEFLGKHISDDSHFTSTMQYDLPNIPMDEKTVNLGKKEYISHVLESLKTAPDRETKTRIEDIEIAHNTTEARVITTSYEKGLVSIDNGEEKPVPVAVTGISYCEQKIVLKNKTISMAGATFSTSVQTPDTQ